MEPKIDFGEAFFRCVFRMRFGINFWSIFGGSEPQKSCSRLDGSMIFTNSTLSKKAKKIIDFWSILEGKFEQKSIKHNVQKRIFFACRFLIYFFGF